MRLHPGKMKRIPDQKLAISNELIASFPGNSLSFVSVVK